MASIPPEIEVAIAAIVVGAATAIGGSIISAWSNTRNAVVGEMKALNEVLHARITDLERALADCMGRVK